jgi:hypothetical protein
MFFYFILSDMLSKNEVDFACIGCEIDIQASI